MQINHLKTEKQAISPFFKKVGKSVIYYLSSSLLNYTF